jgi:hypothetical protein
VFSVGVLDIPGVQQISDSFQLQVWQRRKLKSRPIWLLPPLAVLGNPLLSRRRNIWAVPRESPFTASITFPVMELFPNGIPWLRNMPAETRLFSTSALSSLPTPESSSSILVKNETTPDGALFQR